MSEGFQTHLFRYRFKGEVWAFEILARSEQDAKERMAQLPWATYDGVLIARVPAAFGPFARIAVAVRNWWHE